MTPLADDLDRDILAIIGARRRPSPWRARSALIALPILFLIGLLAFGLNRTDRIASLVQSPNQPLSPVPALPLVPAQAPRMAEAFSAVPEPIPASPPTPARAARTVSAPHRSVRHPRMVLAARRADTEAVAASPSGPSPSATPQRHTTTATIETGEMPNDEGANRLAERNARLAALDAIRALRLR